MVTFVLRRYKIRCFENHKVRHSVRRLPCENCAAARSWGQETSHAICKFLYPSPITPSESTGDRYLSGRLTELISPHSRSTSFSVLPANRARPRQYFPAQTSMWKWGRIYKMASGTTKRWVCKHLLSSFSSLIYGSGWCMFLLYICKWPYVKSFRNFERVNN